MTWNEAQVYCRQHHFDLVTVQNNEDWTNVQREVQPALTSAVWIGLYNNISSWRWSYQNEDISFTRWSGSEPNNADGKEECVIISSSGWHDAGCSTERRFICFIENETQADRFVFVNIPMSWHEAQSYCRQHYTDLAVIHIQTEDQVLTLKMSMTDISESWIGLFRDSWKWSDEINVVDVSSINWMTGQPDLRNLNQPCGVIRPDGLIDDQLCSNTFPFICKTPQTKKQIVRFEVKSGQNVNDPAVMKTILQSIQQKLTDLGVHNDTTVTWRVQPDGNVFTPKHEDEDEDEEEQKVCSDF
ncbi:macrophage mannose receptor 1-like isoform X2 [Triplophysa dalaica]|nr:macrophage mannose receptor 1-like isoform X2 [Triplophysa dalaica]